MRNLLSVFLLLVVCIVGVGLYQGWFHFSTISTDQGSSATVTMDKDKMLEDEQTVKDKVRDFGQEAKETTGGQNDKTKE